MDAVEKRARDLKIGMDIGRGDDETAYCATIGRAVIYMGNDAEEFGRACFEAGRLSALTPSEVEVERVAAVIYEMETGDPWTVAGVEHPIGDRDYYRDMARAAIQAIRSQP